MSFKGQGRWGQNNFCQGQVITIGLLSDPKVNETVELTYVSLIISIDQYK
jgi:hypothetical protein